MRTKNVSVMKARVVGTVLLIAALYIANYLASFYVASIILQNSETKDVAIALTRAPFFWFQNISYLGSVAPDAVSQLLLVLGCASSILVFLYVLGIGIMTRGVLKNETAHGTARFAKLGDLEKSGLLPNEGGGVYCGGFRLKRGKVQYLRHNGPEHICALAPTRSGKGVGLVVPTLLSWPHSVFVLDRKGENFAMTAGWRGRNAQNTILRFDPAEAGSSCSWNPLSEIRFLTRYQISDAQNIALMVIDDDGKGIAGDHFRSAAFELLQGIIMHALYKSREVGRIPGLADCAGMLRGVGEFATKETIEANDDGDPSDPRALTELFQEMSDVSYGEEEVAMEAKLVVNGVGKRMKNTPARELGSIISTANNALSLYRDPVVGENTTRSDFKVVDLMNHVNPVSLYFITTPRNADRMRPLARLLLSQIVLTLADRMEYDQKGRSKTMHKHRLLLMLDEFPTLGKLEVFESALAYIAGYGIKAYIITQDVQQLYKAYSNYESIISNCHIRIAFAPNKLETADWLSKMTGQTTVVKEQVSASGKRFGLVLEQTSTSFQETQRPLMTPDEIMRLPGPQKTANGDIVSAGEMLIFVAGQPVIKGQQILYFLDPTFSARSQIAPPSEPGAICLSPNSLVSKFVI